jgi:hypothetical protein
MAEKRQYAVTLRVTSRTNPGFTETLLTTAHNEAQARESAERVMIQREGGLSPALQIEHVRTELLTLAGDDSDAAVRRMVEETDTWQTSARAARTNAELAMSMRAAHIEALAEAEKHLQLAAGALHRAENTAADWGERGSDAEFRRQVSELLSCDDDEAGLIPYIRLVAEGPRRGRRARR